MGGSRDEPRSERAARIERAGLEGVVADPGRVGTVLDHVADVAVVGWLLGSAVGDEDAIAAIHAARLERLLEELVDTPVRGFLYEAAGSVPRQRLHQGMAVARAAAERWRIPVEVIDRDPSDWRRWSAAAADAVRRLTGG